jgi:Coenzyme PQQ synthesis protein D (PqqD)
VQEQTLPTAGSPPIMREFRLPQHVVHRAFVSETVVLNLSTGKYYGVNPTGGRMLEVLEATPNVEAAASVLADEFSVSLDQVRADLNKFCEDLVERGLLEIVGDSPGE